MYYVGNIPCTPSDIQHFGIKGMKWGIRRYQNPDGSLTAAGKNRYLTSSNVGKAGGALAGAGAVARLAGRSIQKRVSESAAENIGKGIKLGQAAYNAKKAYDTFKNATSSGTPFGFTAKAVAQTGSKLLSDLNTSNAALSAWYKTQEARRAVSIAGSLLSSNGQIAIGVGGAIIAGTVAYKVGKKIVDGRQQKKQYSSK